MTTGRRLVGRDTLAGVIAFWAIASLIFLAGRWYLPAEFPGRLIDRAAAAAIPVDDPTADPADQLGLLRSQLTTLGESGAAVVITGAVQVHDVLDNVEPLSDCFGCLSEIGGGAGEVRFDDPVHVGIRYWQGTTVLSITANGAPIEQPFTDLRVQLNAGGKVFFGRECTLTMERSVHYVYSSAVEDENVELFELRSFGGRLECGRLVNPTTGDTVALVAVFTYEVPG